MPTFAITEVPFKIAQAKGFYREEGLDVEMILIRGALGVTRCSAARWITPPRRDRSLPRRFEASA